MKSHRTPPPATPQPTIGARTEQPRPERDPEGAHFTRADWNTLLSLATAIALALRIWQREHKERAAKRLRSTRRAK